MYAVVKTGGKQYRVTPGDVIRVEKLAAEAGAVVELDEVLMLAGESAPLQVGAPRLEGAVVTATVLEQMRDDTVLVFKKKRRHNYRRKRGHRQYLTVLRIGEILPPGSPRPAAAAEAPAPAPSAAETAAEPAAAPKTATPARKPAAKSAAPAKEAAAKDKAKPAARAKTGGKAKAGKDKE